MYHKWICTIAQLNTLFRHISTFSDINQIKSDLKSIYCVSWKLLFLINDSSILFFLKVNIVLSKLFNLLKTGFQQFKIHRRRKNIDLELFGFIRKNFNRKRQSAHKGQTSRNEYTQKQIVPLLQLNDKNYDLFLQVWEIWKRLLPQRCHKDAPF